MHGEGVKRLPIVGADGTLVGLVSRRDILRVFARPDNEIIGELTDHVVRKVLWIDARRLAIGCQDGNVTLTGKLETRSDAQLLVELARRLDGVVSVVDHLTWDVDNTKMEMVSPPMAGPRW